VTGAVARARSNQHLIVVHVGVELQNRLGIVWHLYRNRVCVDVFVDCITYQNVIELGPKWFWYPGDSSFLGLVGSQNGKIDYLNET
jgi:hypothetical protein